MWGACEIVVSAAISLPVHEFLTAPKDRALHERLLADDEVAGRSQRILPNGGRLTGVLSDAEKFLETSPAIVRAEYADQVGISHHSGTEFSVARLWIRPGQDAIASAQRVLLDRGIAGVKFVPKYVGHI
jgi:hypothetical protein